MLSSSLGFIADSFNSFKRQSFGRYEDNGNDINEEEFYDDANDNGYLDDVEPMTL